MTTSWLAFVPRYLATRQSVGDEQRFEVVALFADVSGFTPISEALSKTGRAGTEELTTILNSYFTPMIDLIESYGGIVGKFGGDAMTVLFPFIPSDRHEVVQRAVQCALDMQAQMPRYDALSTSAGTFSLAMKAGLALGTVYCTSVGRSDLRLEYIIAGQPLDLCADAEHVANKGEVVIHQVLLSELEYATLGDQRGDFHQILEIGENVATQPLPPLPNAPEDAIPLLRAYLHPTIAHRLAYGQVSFINEHRKVSILFVRFGGFDYDHDPQVGEKLQAYVQKVIEIVHKYDGYLNKVDMGDKGSKYIILFGAPVAHENDEERAVRCALELLRLPDVTAQIGINTGFVYAGLVGSNKRQEYTVIGDVVNLAARLMQAASPDSILVSQETHHLITTPLAWEPLQPIRVKGKADLIQVFSLTDATETATPHFQEPRYALPMVGREAELAQIDRILKIVLSSSGQIIGITAEAGLGKSRLNAEIIARAIKYGFIGYGGECQSYGTTTSYLVWHNIWRGFFGITHSPDEQIQILSDFLWDIDPNILQRLPLLGSVLNITIPDNDLTASLEPQLKQELLHDLLLTCIRYLAKHHPFMLVLEDCHWIDPLSQALLDYVARNSVDLPLLIVVLYRPMEQKLDKFHHFTEITLAEFTPEEARLLIELKLTQLFGEDQLVAPDLIERFVSSASGNPFYIEELINYVHDRQIDPHDIDALMELELPDSLYSLILSRIDQLSEDEKIILKIASVIGRLFRASWIWGFYPDVGTPETVKDKLSRLSRIDLIPLDKPEPELEYLFKHIMTQAVAYESLAYALRATLHEQLAAFIEATYAPETYVELLAFHYGNSENTTKKAHYFLWAGNLAKAHYANEAAIYHYQRLLPLLPVSEKPSIMRQIGEIWQLTGQWEAAEQIFQEALAIAEQVNNMHEIAYCLDAIGYLHSTKAEHEHSITWLERANTSFEGLNDPKGLSRTYEHLGFAHWQLGNYDEAIRFSEKQLALAPDGHSQSNALRNIAGVYLHRGLYPEALSYFQQALEIAQKSHFRQGEIYASGNMGVVHGMSGDYTQAIQHYSQAIQAAHEIGYSQIVGILIANLGDVFRLLGVYNAAMNCNKHALAIALDLGDWRAIMVISGNIGTLLAMQKHYADSIEWFSRILHIKSTFDFPYHSCEYLHAYAELLSQLNQFAEAIPLNEEALQLAIQMERQDIQFAAQVLAIRLRVLTNDLDFDTAIIDYQNLLTSTEDDSQRATLFYEIWRLDSSLIKARQNAAAYYESAYAASPNATYRHRYVELTGRPLPAPPELPPTLSIITQNPVDLDILLRRLDKLMESAL